MTLGGPWDLSEGYYRVEVVAKVLYGGDVVE